MSDFFSGIYGGVHAPDVVMNQGPLPPTSSAGMPAGFGGTPDAKIDYSSTLLGDLDPYAYGEPGRLSTQAAYLNIPHVAQRIVPQINIPESHPTSRGGSFMMLNHQVDDGDIGFIVRAMFSPYDLVSDKKKYNRQGILFAIDPVMNLATTNYILHGLQRYGFDRKDGKNWHSLWMAFGIDDYFKSLDGIELSTTMMNIREKIHKFSKVAPGAAQNLDHLGERMSGILEMRHHRRRLAEYIIKNIITPFGIPRGSEKQGGQHQGVVGSTVTNPVDFVTSMIIDGKAINLANFWRQEDISAGDDLMLYLSDKPYVQYTLSHNPRSRKTVQFEPLERWEAPKALISMSGDDRKLSDQSSRAFVRIWNLISDVNVGTKQNINDRMIPITGVLGAGLQPRQSDDNIQTTWGGINGTRIARKDAVREIMMATTFAADSQKFEDWVNASNRISKNTGNATSIRLMRERIITEMKRLNDQWRNISSTRKTSKNLNTSSGWLDDLQVVPVDESIFQLIPGVSSSSNNNVKDAIWKKGYWHIARSQIMQFKYDQHADIPNGAVAATSGKLLEVTFAPVWVEPLEADSMSGISCTIGSTMAQVDDQDTARPHMKRPKVTPQALTFGFLTTITNRAETSINLVASCNRSIMFSAPNMLGNHRQIFEEIVKAVKIAGEQQTILASREFFDIRDILNGRAYTSATPIGGDSPFELQAAAPLPNNPGSTAEDKRLLQEAKDQIIARGLSQWGMFLGEGCQGNATTQHALNHNLIRAAAYGFMPIRRQINQTGKKSKQVDDFFKELIRDSNGNYSIVDSIKTRYPNYSNFPVFTGDVIRAGHVAMYTKFAAIRASAWGIQKLLYGVEDPADYAYKDLCTTLATKAMSNVNIFPNVGMPNADFRDKSIYVSTAIIPLGIILASTSNVDGGRYTIDPAVRNVAGTQLERILDSIMEDKFEAGFADPRWIGPFAAGQARQINQALIYNNIGDLPADSIHAGAVGQWLEMKVQYLIMASVNTAIQFANESEMKNRGNASQGNADPGAIFASAFALQVVSAFLKCDIPDQDDTTIVYPTTTVSLRQGFTIRARGALAPRIHKRLFDYIMSMSDPYETVYMNSARFFMIASFAAQGVFTDLSRVYKNDVLALPVVDYTDAMMEEATSPEVFDKLLRMGEAYAKARIDDSKDHNGAFMDPVINAWASGTTSFGGLNGATALNLRFVSDMVQNLTQYTATAALTPAAVPILIVNALYNGFRDSENTAVGGRNPLHTAAGQPQASSDVSSALIGNITTTNSNITSSDVGETTSSAAATTTTIKKVVKKKKVVTSNSSPTPFQMLEGAMNDPMDEDDNDDENTNSSGSSKKSSSEGGFKRVSGTTKRL